MKVGLFTDAHFCAISSILNSRSGYKYSARLDALIKSFKWMYEVFQSNNVDFIINGGDLIDSNLIKADEGSALAEALSYNPGIHEYYLLGNHEKLDDAGKFHSLALLNRDNITVVSQPMTLNDYKIALLPYTRDYESINFKELSNNGEIPILVSHMNYYSMMIDNYKLDNGLDMDEATKYFKLILNGHIHNYGKYKDEKIINIGSMFGSGFNDSYDTHYPSIAILDTETLDIQYFTNPYSVLFFKFKCNSINDILKSLKKYSNITNPKCIRVEVPHDLRDDAREYIDNISNKYNIISSRIQGKITSSTIFKSSDKEVINNYESGIEALEKYLDTFDESDLPDTKINMVDFINEYLKGE